MAIGTSLGAYFDTEMLFHMNSFHGTDDPETLAPNPGVMKDRNELGTDEFEEKNELRNPNKPVTQV